MVIVATIIVIIFITTITLVIIYIITFIVINDLSLIILFSLLFVKKSEEPLTFFEVTVIEIKLQTFFCHLCYHTSGLVFTY